jgi:hypothetical protein
MFISTNELTLDALAVVVIFGIGFLLWTLAHLFRDTHPHPIPRQELFIQRPQRR